MLNQHRVKFQEAKSWGMSLYKQLRDAACFQSCFTNKCQFLQTFSNRQVWMGHVGPGLLPLGDQLRVCHLSQPGCCQTGLPDQVWIPYLSERSSGSGVSSLLVREVFRLMCEFLTCRTGFQDQTQVPHLSDRFLEAHISSLLARKLSRI